MDNNFNLTRALSTMRNSSDRKDAIIMFVRCRAKMRGATPLDVQRNIERLSDLYPNCDVIMTAANTAHY